MKYGFVYMWYDCKHRKYYIGRHWGTIDDGYICSSTNMRNNYRNRPFDFKRRILSYVYTSIDDLVLEEQKWLDLIDVAELNCKYYNKTKSSSTPSTRGYKHSQETRNKISQSNRGKKLSEETKQKLRKANKKQFDDPQQRLTLKDKIKSLWQDPEYRKFQTENKKGRRQSVDTIEKRKETWNRIGFDPSDVGFKKGHEPWNKGKIMPIISQSRWWNNGTINKRSLDCPGPDFNLGRTKNGS